MKSKKALDTEALNERYLLACENADIPLVRSSLVEGAEGSARNSSGETALHLAVKSGSRDMVEYILQEMLVNPNARDAFGRTPLHWAAQQGNVPVSEALLLAHANIEAKDDMGVEAKIYAEMSGHRELVKIFGLVRKVRR